MGDVFCSDVEEGWNSQKYTAFKLSRSTWLKQSDGAWRERERKAGASFAACLVLVRSSPQRWTVVSGSRELGVQIPASRALLRVSDEGLWSPLLQWISATYKVIIMEAKLGGSFL